MRTVLMRSLPRSLFFCSPRHPYFLTSGPKPGLGILAFLFLHFLHLGSVSEEMQKQIEGDDIVLTQFFLHSLYALQEYVSVWRT